jgi:gamma-glutamyltranspeptidase / glutathione hydrolase
MRVHALRIGAALVLSAASLCAQESRLPLPKGASWAGHLDSARYGMVVAARTEAAAIGVAIMKRGGNAVDAAVATHFALAVCYPFAGNIGGGGFLLMRTAKGEVESLDFRERAPAAATERMLLDSAGRYSVKRALQSHLAAGVPGSVAGMAEVHRRYGKLRWAEVVQPAIDLARSGYRATAIDARDLGDSTYRAALRARNTVEPPFLKETPVKAGSTLRWLELAETLVAIRDSGAAGFYSGRVAALIVAEMQRGGGLISLNDLQAYRAVWRKPLRGTYGGYTVHAMPPPSSGGLTLLQTLGMLEPTRSVGQGLTYPARAHAFVEAERRAFADRAVWIGDPEHVLMPIERLLEAKYLAYRFASFSPERATPSSTIREGSLTGFESNETTHYSVVDADGMAVSVTTTLNRDYGSGIMVGGAGFFLNNEMDDFSAQPGVPNSFGLTGGTANAIAPGKRMVSSMCPTIVDSAGQLRWVLGAPGGSRIPSGVLNVLLNRIDGAMPLAAAVGQARLHHQWRPDSVRVESRGEYPVGLLDSLRARGHVIVPISGIALVNAIERTRSGMLIGVADPRHPDAAALGQRDASRRKRRP